jgi:hypothetical protein
VALCENKNEFDVLVQAHLKAHQRMVWASYQSQFPREPSWQAKRQYRRGRHVENLGIMKYKNCFAKSKCEKRNDEEGNTLSAFRDGLAPYT